MDLLTVLEKTVSNDTHELGVANTFLQQAAQQNFPELLRQLSDVLRNGGNSAVARMQAGLQLKNALYSKDSTIRAEHQKRWLVLPDDVRTHIKTNIMAALGTETTRPSSAAQCVASVACAEIPQGLWLELITTLTAIMTKPDTTEVMREATLEAIGYICQDISDPDLLQSKSNEILTAIVQGMKKEEKSNLVRQAATNALCNSLEFSKVNFNNDTERNYIMQVVCEATQSDDNKVKVAALQCLVKIMSLYYVHMEHYMGLALFAITMEAMKSDIDEIALQGIEFWSNVCDEEVDLAIEASEAAEQGKPPERTSKFYVKGALHYLIPILLQILTKQEESDDDDEWNPCKAAGVCLMLMATCTDDAIVPHVLPFVKSQIKNDDWKFRDAAVMAFGSILEGPDTTGLKPVVIQAMPMLIELLADTSVVVQDTSAWTIGRICEIVPDAVINEQSLEPLIGALLIGLGGEPRVAANVCWAFSSLAEAAYEASTEETTEPETYVLSRYFELIVPALLKVTDREDGNQHNLRSAAYEAIMEMVKNSPADCYGSVQKTTVIILDKLQHVLSMDSNAFSMNDKMQVLDLQSLLCATLQSVLRKVTTEDAPQISDRIMLALLQMLSGSGEKMGGVQEDALLAVSTLIEVLGDKFMTYMDAFKPYLCMGLKNFSEHQVCLAAVGATGDISRSLGIKVLPYCNEIMTILLENLGNENVHRSVKPQILAVFGDIALAIGSNFTIYLEVVLGTLQQASQALVEKTDYDMIDYMNDLWEGCLVAYTGIVQGLKGDNQQVSNEVNLLQNHVQFMVSFVEHIAVDEDKTDTVVAVACGLVGDLLSAFGAAILVGIDKEPITSLLVYGRRCKYAKAKSLASWATKEIKKLKALQQEAVKPAASWLVD